ncbi:MAG: restriction endonuclease [Pseudomonadota bacterium]
MAKNSIFAILLRSPWWYSMVIVLVFVAAARALLPEPYAPFAMMGACPFLVIGAIRAWRQWQAPSPKRVSAALVRAGVLSWQDFSSILEQAFAKQGYAVTRLKGAAADFQLLQDGRVTLVSCKRWKAAGHGVDALRDLALAQQAMAAQQGIYISLAGVSDKARRYAQEQGIRLMTPAELGHLMVQVA